MRVEWFSMSSKFSISSLERSLDFLARQLICDDSSVQIPMDFFYRPLTSVMPVRYSFDMESDSSTVSPVVSSRVISSW